MARLIPIDTNATPEEKKRYYRMVANHYRIIAVGLMVIVAMALITCIIMTIITFTK